MIFLNSRLVWFLLGMILGASLLFLAENRTSEKQEISTIKAKETIISAKKERGALSIKQDSITKIIIKHPTKQKRYKEIDEKVNRITTTATDVQLDSILSNYRYFPLSKETSSKWIDSLR